MNYTVIALQWFAIQMVMMLVAACATGPEQSGSTMTSAATLVIENGYVWTGDRDNPIADAIAVVDDRIVAVGTASEIQTWIGRGTERVDAAGGLIAPGFIDSHVHLLTGGLHLASVQLRDAATPETFVDRIATFASMIEPGEWITGGDWDHENWGGKLPMREWIDAVTPTNPVWINRLDGHMSLANTVALELAGISRSTGDVDGGEIVRGAGGEPTGILKDNAMSLVDRVVPAHSDRYLDEALEAAMSYLNAQGVTSVHDMSGESGSFQALGRMHRRGAMSVRVYEAFPIGRWRELAGILKEEGRGDDWLHVGGLKAFVDGSLGSHTAAFFEPFSDEPGDSGMFVSDLGLLKRQMNQADSAQLQLFVHAIGDRAISELLDVFMSIRKTNGTRDRRNRIEHAQHIRPADIKRFAEEDIIASMQPYHAIDDGRWAEKVIGPERIKTTYAFRSLLDADARLAFGSDWFVAPPTPIEGIYAAVTRQTLDDRNPGGWVPEQKINLEEALMAYTADAAFAGFTESSTGQLKVGYLADLVILDTNLFDVVPDSIRNATVAFTIVNGEIVFTRNGDPDR